MLLDKLKLLRECPEVDRIEESEILNKEKETIGWNYSITDSRRMVLSSGTSADKRNAHLKAIGELLERSLVKKLSKADRKAEFALDYNSSSSGFAFGFNSLNAKKRSFCEAIERWALSSWIDGRCPVTEVEGCNHFCSLASFFSNSFLSVRSFRKTFYISEESGQKVPYYFHVIVGFTENGAFLGASVDEQDDQWTHSMIEAYRDLKIAERGTDFQCPPGIVLDRIDFFSQNRVMAENVLARDYNCEWPIPEILMQAVYVDNKNSWYLWRTLMKNYIPMNQGSVERFVI